MKIRFFFVFCFLCTSGIVTAQFQTYLSFQSATRLRVPEREYQKDTLQFFYNYWGKKCIPQQARYFIYAAPQDQLWYYTEYYLPDKRMSAEGTFSDKALRIPEGTFHHFHPNGKLRERGMYFEGKRTGWWLKYDEDGHHTDSILYLNGLPAGKGIIKYGDGAIKEILDMDRSGHGSGTSTTYFPSGELWTIGKFINGMKKDSVWTAFYRNGSTSFIALYRNDTLIQQQCYDTTGTQMEECVGDRRAQYPGGTDEFLACLQSKGRFPVGYDFSNTSMVHVLFSFDISETGAIQNPKVIQGIHRSFDKIFLSEVFKCNKWQPRLLYNIPVVETKYVPWTFVGNN